METPSTEACATLTAHSLTFAVGEPGTYVQVSPEAKGARGYLSMAFQLPDHQDQVETTLRGRTASSGSHQRGVSMTQLLPCPACEKKVSRDASFCPNCGHPLDDEWVEEAEEEIRAEERKNRNGCVFLILLLFAMVIFPVLKMGFGGSGSSEVSGDSESSRPSSERSVNNQERSSQTPYNLEFAQESYEGKWPFTVPSIVLGCENLERGSIVRPHVYAWVDRIKYGLNGAAMGYTSRYSNGREITKKEDEVWMDTSDFIKQGLALCDRS